MRRNGFIFAALVLAAGLIVLFLVRTLDRASTTPPPPPPPPVEEPPAAPDSIEHPPFETPPDSVPPHDPNRPRHGHKRGHGGK